MCIELIDSEKKTTKLETFTDIVLALHSNIIVRLSSNNVYCFEVEVHACMHMPWDRRDHKVSVMSPTH